MTSKLRSSVSQHTSDRLSVESFVDRGDHPRQPCRNAFHTSRQSSSRILNTYSVVRINWVKLPILLVGQLNREDEYFPVPFAPEN